MPAARPDPQRLFSALRPYTHAALAVSGGSDSVALLRLAADWAGGHNGLPKLSVLTVDHGLRPAAAAEAGQVAGWSARLGLAHAVLHWSPVLPMTGVQAKARTARYDLMSAWCAAHGADVLLTAHTLEDQAETVLMRLARTTSLDSLAGIHRFSQWNGIAVFRPLLGEKRHTLRGYLEGLGQGWCEDPSNDDERFERVRLRKAMPALRDIGITVEGLAQLAQRAADASQALWAATGDWVAHHVRTYDTGYCSVPLDAYRTQTRDLQTRILGWLIRRFGAGRMPEPVELELLAAWLPAGASGRRTLGGAIIARRKSELLIGREAGRIDAAPVSVPESGVLLWDGRFEVRAAAGAQIVAARCGGPRPRRKDIPGFVQAALPVVILAGKPALWPHLAAGSEGAAVFRPGSGR